MHVRGGFAEFCAILQYAARETDGGVGAPPMAVTRPSTPDTNDLDKPMLVSIVDFMEPPERTVSLTTLPSVMERNRRSVSSFVWLQPLNHCLMFFAERLNHSQSVPIEMRDEFFPLAISFSRSRQPGIWGNWVLVARVLGVQQCELINETVECGNRRLWAISPMKTPHWGRGRQTSHVHAIDIISRLRIQFRSDDVILGILPEGVLGQSETLDFTFCTSYLERRGPSKSNICYSPTMKGKKMQKTPKGHEIPIPSREDFLKNLDRAAKPPQEHPHGLDALRAKVRN